MRPLRGAGLALLVGVLGACTPETGWVYATPPTVDEAGLAELLTPRADERFVLANFWATW